MSKTYIVPAEGTFYTREGIPASAFSRGDMLMLNGASNLSKMVPLFASNAKLAGIALADSTNSIRGKVTYAVPHAETVFWSTCTPGSSYSRGDNVNFNQDADGHMIANASTGTVRAVCIKGVNDVEGQSVESRIQIRFTTVQDSNATVISNTVYGG